MRALLNDARFRWLLTLTYTIVFFILLVQPGDKPVLGPRVPEGPPSFGRDMIFTAGHIGLVAILTGFWWWALERTLSKHSSPFKALVLAMAVALLVATIGEFVQTLSPDRHASLLDLSANALGTATAGVALWLRGRLQARRQNQPLGRTA
ncbi:MAG: VanZ family protein [Burkholderiales bacterium]|nr:VanZ family protein [Anaerolineae bacterium]